MENTRKEEKRGACTSPRAGRSELRGPCIREELTIWRAKSERRGTPGGRRRGRQLE